jgi:ABC-2 type transport system permease protein
MTAFTGTWRLVRLALRRDRVQLPLWLLGLVLLEASTVSSIVGLYPDEQERLNLAVTSANSPVSLMTNGLVSGSSLGATTMTQGLSVLGLGVAFMSTLAVVRHTRQNEETGRAEMIGAGIVGRHASLTAALIVVAGANIVFALLAALTLIGNDLPGASSVLAGVSLGFVGIAFGAIAAVAAQISETARGANGMAAAAIGVAFLLRAVGDVAGKTVEGGTKTISAWPSWLSPIGWSQQTRAYDDDNWWVLGLFVVTVVGLVGLAFELTAHRDVGAGMRAVRPGAPAAAPSLLSPLGLAWRLQRGVLLGWAVAMVVLGATYGGIGDEIEEMVGDSDAMADYIEQLGGTGTLTENYFATTLLFAGIAASGYAIQTLLRMRSEEAADRVEPVLATSVSRARWMVSHIVIAVLGVVALVVLMGLSTGVTYGLVIGDVGGQVPTLVGAALVQAPAALALAGLAVAVFGLLPRRAVAIAWTAFALCLLMGQLGVILDLPQAVLNLSPFTHLPAAPADDVVATPLIMLLVVAAALLATGMTAFRRRDLALG